MKTLAIDALILAVITSIGVKLVDIYLHFSMVWSIWAVVMGALIGTWVSFGARKFEICFDDLASLEKDKMKQRFTRGYKRYKETSGLIEWKECQIFHSIFT